MKKKIALFGYSGHAFVVADALLAAGHLLLGYYDRAEALKNPYNLTYLGNEGLAGTLAVLKEKEGYAMVSVGENKIRRKVMEYLKLQGIAFTSVLHPASQISAMATIGVGSFVAAGAKVNPLASVGAGAILNTGCIVEHECSLANYVHVAPGAVLAGSVVVGDESFIGANAVVKQGVRIGRNVVIGAGAVVIKDVPDGQTWAGNPAKAIKQ